MSAILADRSQRNGPLAATSECGASLLIDAGRRDNRAGPGAPARGAGGRRTPSRRSCRLRRSAAGLPRGAKGPELLLHRFVVNHRPLCGHLRVNRFSCALVSSSPRGAGPSVRGRRPPHAPRGLGDRGVRAAPRSGLCRRRLCASRRARLGAATSDNLLIRSIVDQPNAATDLALAVLVAGGEAYLDGQENSERDGRFEDSVVEARHAGSRGVRR